MRVSNIVLFSAGDMSGDLVSNAISLNQIFGWSAQLVYTGSPVGSITVEVSNDPSLVAEGSAVAPTNWTLLPSSAVAVSAAGSNVYNYEGTFYNWVRIKYTFTSGTGSFSGRMNLKGV